MWQIGDHYNNIKTEKYAMDIVGALYEAPLQYQHFTF